MIKRLVRRRAGAVYRSARRRLLSERERAIEEWKAAGHESLRLDYDLDESAVVVDVGGYGGQWTSDIVARYLCRVHVYEPVPAFAERIRRRFARNPLVTVHEVGLAAATREEAMYVRDTASSVFGEGPGPSETIRLVRAADAFRDAEIERIDLLKLNIEGSEYELLEHLIDDGWIEGIRHVQVQFHDLGPGSRKRMEELRARLAATHELSWRKELVWESWKRRAS